jgi:hypothetical protein
MTYKAIIRELHKRLHCEKKRLPALRYSSARTRTKGRIQGLEIAIRIAEKLREKRMAEA